MTKQNNLSDLFYYSTMGQNKEVVYTLLKERKASATKLKEETGLSYSTVHDALTKTAPMLKEERGVQNKRGAVFYTPTFAPFSKAYGLNNKEAEELDKALLSEEVHNKAIKDPQVKESPLLYFSLALIILAANPGGVMTYLAKKGFEKIMKKVKKR